MSSSNPYEPSSIPPVSNANTTPPDSAFAGGSAQLQQQLSRGAGWFYWIAGLSIINYVIIVLGSDRSFIIGLGITTACASIAQGAKENGGAMATILQVVALMVTIVAAGVCILLGILGNRRHTWAIIVGMIGYALDGCLYLLFGDWLSVGFHGFVLFCLYQGMSASMQLNKLQSHTVAMTPNSPGNPFK